MNFGVCGGKCFSFGSKTCYSIFGLVGLSLIFFKNYFNHWSFNV
jgi:hypothetical protein